MNLQSFEDEYRALLAKHSKSPEEAVEVSRKLCPTKRAVLIGINYTGQRGELSGCHNDVDNMVKYLSTCGFTKFTVLKDSEYVLNSLQPTHANILYQLERNISRTRAGDTLYVHYSGHGSYTRDLSGDEIDGRDETICPIDYAKSGDITDDVLRELFLRADIRAKIRVCFDACHSGSALDLPVRWVSHRRQVVENISGGSIENKHDIVFISGCMDSQTSADAWIDRKATGAMTYALLKTLWEMKKAGPFTWCEIITLMRVYLKGERYEQIPQLSAEYLDIVYTNCDLI